MSKTSSVFTVFILALVAAIAAYHWLPARWNDMGAILVAFIVLAVGLLASASHPQPYNDSKFWE